jgi:hypothetical protein
MFLLGRRICEYIDPGERHKLEHSLEIRNEVKLLCKKSSEMNLGYYLHGRNYSQIHETILRGTVGYIDTESRVYCES